MNQWWRGVGAALVVRCKARRFFRFAHSDLIQHETPIINSDSNLPNLYLDAPDIYILLIPGQAWFGVTSFPSKRIKQLRNPKDFITSGGMHALHSAAHATRPTIVATRHMNR